MESNQVVSQRRSKQVVQSIVERWKQSGHSKSQFCLENNFNYQTFIGWVKPKKKKSVKKGDRFSAESGLSGFASLKIKNVVGETFAEVQGGDAFRHRTILRPR